VKHKNAAFHEFKLDGAFLHIQLLKWYTAHEKPLPWRVLWKTYNDPWHIWVSEIMLQQTVIKAVLPVYERFLKRFPTVDSLANASTEEVRLAVRGLGYYRRFDALHRATKLIASGMVHFPKNHDEWLELPGIGSYTAAAISSITQNEPYGVVDGNVERVFCRLLDIRTEPNLPHLKKSFKQKMDELCQKGHSGTFNQAVMELGQSICTPTSPNCEQCPIKKKCLAYSRNSQALAPAAKAKAETIDVAMTITIPIYGDDVILCQRPSTSKFLRGTWGFEIGSTLKKRATHIGAIKHNITKHKITADVASYKLNSLVDSLPLRRLKPSEIEENLVSNLDRKAWFLYLKNQEFQNKSREHTKSHN
jgi:A/G-specific adenine glycosylase